MKNQLLIQQRGISFESVLSAIEQGGLVDVLEHPNQDRYPGQLIYVVEIDETIHPFLDGNGRVGRLLITLLLCAAGLLSQPLLYLSLYFKQHRGDYYDLLNHVRRTGDWEAWIGFFLEGVKRTAEGAVSTARSLSRMFQDDRNRIQAAGGRKTGSALRVHDALKARPILSLPAACRNTKLSFQATASAMELLASHGVAREITGKRRNRLFVYDRYLSVLNEEAEAP